jgi:hypothetical protein
VTPPTTPNLTIIIIRGGDDIGILSINYIKLA